MTDRQSPPYTAVDAGGRFTDVRGRAKPVIIFVTRLVRGGEGLVTVAELAGHAPSGNAEGVQPPTDEDKQSALRHLTVDR